MPEGPGRSRSAAIWEDSLQSSYGRDQTGQVQSLLRDSSSSTERIPSQQNGAEATRAKLQQNQSELQPFQ